MTNHHEAIITLETIYRYGFVKKQEPTMHIIIGQIVKEYNDTHDADGRITEEAFMKGEG